MHDLRSTLRVGIDANSILGDRGGVGWYTYLLLRALVELKQGAEIVAYVRPGAKRRLDTGLLAWERAARKHGLTVAEIKDWQERFLLTSENALRSRPKDEETLLPDPERRRLMRQAGRRRVVERFRLEQTVAAIQQMYDELHLTPKE